MRNYLIKCTLVGLAILILNTSLLAENGEASTSEAPYDPPTSHWWEIPFQPPEKLLSPRQEDDEWYKQYQQKKYRKRR